MDKIDLFFDKEYRAFYNELKHKQDNITCMIDGNICRICVCENEEELYRQYYSVNLHLQELLRLQKSKLLKQENRIAELRNAKSLEKSNETDKNERGRE